MRVNPRKLKPGWVVEVRWVDSGRDGASLHLDLATRDTYGRVQEVRKETLVLAMDVCTGPDAGDDSGNQWGFLWIPAIRWVEVLRK